MALKDWVSLIISLLSAGIALAALRVSLLVAKTNLQSQQANFRTNLRVVWTRDLIGWGNACVRMFTEARLLANLRTPTQTEEEFEKTRRRLLCELSAQIDQGRLFFENKLKDRHGTDKEPAYRGFTPRIIQVLKVPYRELTKIKFNCSESQPHPESGPIWKAQRDFVSILQEEVGPSWITKARAYDEPLTSENLQRSTDLLFRQAGPDLDAKRLRSLWTRFQGGTVRALTWRLRSDGR